LQHGETDVTRRTAGKKGKAPAIADFIAGVRTTHATGSATEHSYRPAFESLFSRLGVTALNEPKRTAWGAPDFVISQDGIDIGHVETKDLHIPIRGMKGREKEQQKRYSAGFPNLLYTNGLDWDFYRDGKIIADVRIAAFDGGDIVSSPANYAKLENLLHNFVAQRPKTIVGPEDLARRMANKAALIKDVLTNALNDGEASLSGQYEAFKANLIHDIKPQDFADIYAETIAYGMFAARLQDPTRDMFSRQEALDLLPRSNPFLRSLFGYVAGHDLDDRIAWIIDDLAAVFRACDMDLVMEGFGELTGRNDPFLHFYETFLVAYSPKKRTARGVWYTPEPVVDFIVRAVDDVLKSEFGLEDGLADTSKVTMDWDTGKTNKKGRAVTVSKDVHRVQILDPAAGTGTFLGAVVKQIAPRIQDIAPGLWSRYIENDLIPRLHGFEILIASYAMCHMKIDMILTEMGYEPPTGDTPRLSVWLTDSLEQGEPVDQTLLPFAKWLSHEAKGASEIKRDMPIMCVIGNPPYLGEGGKSEGWLGALMDDYKKEPGGKVKLRERNPKWLNDLYVKFIRLSSHMIERNGEGVLGFITNHGYLDNPTFRGMRWHLLHTFDRIWVLDLHGNAKKRETAADGSLDENVFDIQQGVAIIIAVKRKDNNRDLAQVMHADLWGTRAVKYDTLGSDDLNAPMFEQIDTPAPYHFFVRRDYAEEQAAYEQGFAINHFMPVHSVGIVTARDALTIDENRDALWRRVQDFARLDPEAVRRKYKIEDVEKEWTVALAQKDVKRDLSHDKLTPIAYRPFDTRWTYYTGTSQGFICRPRDKVMRHMLAGENFGFIIPKTKREQVGGIVTDTICGHKAYDDYDINSLFPLYLYPDAEELDKTRRVNFDPTLFDNLRKMAQHPKRGKPDAVRTFDYIYGVLHCPAYRETFAEFLKIDFPRIPWPANPSEFWDISDKGRMLRQLHLMDTAAGGRAPYPLVGRGEGMVENIEFGDGKIWINGSQHFDNTPEAVWDMFIGGYQPAQKWLKDRKDRNLDHADIQHYQRILKVLAETRRIMDTIEMTCRQPPPDA